jgi:glycosyltransferase involved in cell wall biosynthesis
MNKPLLTIALPTYNRREEILKQVGALLPQINDPRVELLIIDNASDFDVREVVLQQYRDAEKCVRFIRNRYNVGLGGNILRSFELADGEWMWLLGDDDTAFPDAVATILDKIEQTASDVILLKFGGEAMVPPIHVEQAFYGIEGMAAHLNSAWRYSSMLFISSSVFRLSFLASFTPNGYHWNYSVAPHLAIVFSALCKNQYAVVIHPKITVTHAIGKWNRWRVSLGASVLGEIEGCEIIAQKSLPQIFKDWSGSAWWLAYPAIILRSGDRPASYWKAYFFRVAGVTTGPLQWYLIFCALFLVPLMQWKATRRIIQRIVGTRSDLGGLERL